MQPPENQSLALNGREVNIQNLPHLQQYNAKRREAKMKEIQTGVDLLQSVGIFPSRRPCQDVVWAVLFLSVVAATACFSIYYFQDIDTSRNEDAAFRDHETLNHQQVEALTAHVGRLTLAGVAGTLASLVFAFFFMMLAKACAKPLVYAALFFVPALTIVAGLVLLGLVMAREPVSVMSLIPGGCLVALGVCYASCVCCCWRRYIPFTVEVVEMVAEISNDNPCMVAVSVLGSFAAAIWVMLVAICWVGVTIKYKSDTADQDLNASEPINFAFLFLICWGGGVIHNVCHTSYCGVFGRWYFNEEGWPLVSSVRVALTTSFGSICLGSLVVAVIRMIEYAVRVAQQEAQSEGNYVACVVFCVLDCFISCIGDILEYFNEWAYVQCALRGSSFCKSVRATYALCVCNGIQYVIADLLVDSVVSLGAFMSGLVGCGMGLAVALSGLERSPDGARTGAGAGQDYAMVAIIGGFLGFFGGVIGGASAMSIFSSGTKALLTCWAEDPRPLQEEYSGIHDTIAAKIHDHESN
ncbi:PNS1 [Symbiodinium pilosum]|uniref:Choline transporter-like protein n=1 Tax=Symbiodinium pilosum TaxID=2952 RepID=A0A812U3C6_SYMPI|nr:PNS1 [Symbiodinium pilosum]